MKRLVGTLLSGAMMLSACATAPDKVEGNYVSPMQYSGYDCEQIRMELQNVSYQVNSMASREAKDRRRDEIAWGVGLFVAWPALLFLAGGDHKEQLATYKGQYDALNEAAIQKKCMVAQEVAADRATAESRGVAQAQSAPSVPSAPPTAAIEPASTAPVHQKPRRCPGGLSSPTDPDAVTCQ